MIKNKILDKLTPLKIKAKFQSFFDFAQHFNLKVKIPNSDKYILFRSNGYQSRSRAKTSLIKEANTIEWIDGFNDASNFLDVGAHMGIFSIYAAVKKNCKVTAIEPCLANLSTLNYNVILNNVFENIFICPNAISNVTQIDKFYVSLGNDKNFRDLAAGFPKKPIATRGEKMTNAYSHAANLITIDELNNKFGPYENIKIDIDGNEKDLILGAEKTFESSSLKSILIELNEKDENFSFIVDHIKNKKFKLNEYLTNKSFISTKRSSKIYNLIFDKD